MKDKTTISDAISVYQGVYRRLYGKDAKIEMRPGGWVMVNDIVRVRKDKLLTMAKVLEGRL